ncbi:hypothetical protein OROHE_004318 [Orobanche hederae]
MLLRYVDTFNKDGGNTVRSFHSPSVPSAKPAAGSANPKFFVLTPISAAEQPVMDTLVEDNKQILLPLRMKSFFLSSK